jgi:hypothetical protein
MGELICPYCEHEQQTHEPDVMSAEMCLTCCENCGQEFCYSVFVLRKYSSERTTDAERQG